MNKLKNLKLWKKILIILAAVLIAGGIACAVYINDYYHADSAALETIENPVQGISVFETENSSIVFEPENPRAGMIFYPGGKVQYEAYAPLMEACAQRGILCVLVHMPGNLAAYSVKDLSETDLAVLSVYGSEDGVLKMDSYEKYRGNLPDDFTESVIPGGCHAYFGSYGPQDGDGSPEISNEDQIRLTADAIEDFLIF